MSELAEIGTISMHASALSSSNAVISVGNAKTNVSKGQNWARPGTAQNLVSPVQGPVSGHHLSVPHKLRQRLVLCDRFPDFNMKSVASVRTQQKLPLLL